MTMGLKFLNDTFGECAAPKAVWQIDPFGHSKEQASIFAQMGFEYLFLGRIDYQDKALRMSNGEMEMMWDASDSLGTEIFTGVLYNTYGPPPGFCFDVLCGDETIVDDPDSPMFNIDRRVCIYNLNFSVFLFSKSSLFSVKTIGSLYFGAIKTL
jgi:lysosomal alpha-mannosidase